MEGNPRHRKGKRTANRTVIKRVAPPPADSFDAHAQKLTPTGLMAPITPSSRHAMKNLFKHT